MRKIVTGLSVRRAQRPTLFRSSLLITLFTVCTLSFAREVRDYTLVWLSYLKLPLFTLREVNPSLLVKMFMSYPRQFELSSNTLFLDTKTNRCLSYSRLSIHPDDVWNSSESDVTDGPQVYRYTGRITRDTTSSVRTRGHVFIYYPQVL